MRSSPSRGFVIPLLLLLLGGPGCAGLQSRLAWTSKGREEARADRPAALPAVAEEPADEAPRAIAPSSPTAARPAAPSSPDSAIWQVPQPRTARLSRWFPLLGARGRAPGAAAPADPYGRLTDAAPPRRALSSGADTEVRPASGDVASAGDGPRRVDLVLGDPEPIPPSDDASPPAPARRRSKPLRRHNLPAPAGDVALGVMFGDAPASDPPALVETPPELATPDEPSGPARAPRREEHLRPASLDATPTDLAVTPAPSAGPQDGKPDATAPPPAPPLDAGAPTSRPDPGLAQAPPQMPSIPSTQPPSPSPGGDSPPPIPGVTSETAPTPPAPSPAQPGQKPPAAAPESRPTAEVGPKPITPGQEPATPPAPAATTPPQTPAAASPAPPAASPAAGPQGPVAGPSIPQPPVEGSAQGRPGPSPTTWRAFTPSSQAPSAQSPARPTAQAVRPSTAPRTSHRFSLLAWLHDLKHPKDSHAKTVRPSSQSPNAQSSPQLPAVAYPTSYGVTVNPPCVRPTPPQARTVVRPSPQSPANLAGPPGPSPQAVVETSGVSGKHKCAWFHWGILSETVHKLKAKAGGDSCSCPCHAAHKGLPGGAGSPCSGGACPWASPQGSPGPQAWQVPTAGSASAQAGRVPKSGDILDRIAAKGLDEAPQR
ncbi:hypothetical protein OJF2_62010 [Aquisphaera giovannonii]|uniref:Uncharacterized protein n=1 Tax=Aquisphaera giovannonii TaxID=406548 RepID=A0A5B9WCK2_9BACT|nr:hypothetical protein [Aquisphaera giovannonii]QEH37610.1 hypothetical protein OJF2_62010 [Aquisphaera giovannonii]